MLVRLHFVALPRPAESPLSLLKRTAEANGFLSLQALASHCTGMPARNLLRLLLGSAPLVETLGQEAGNREGDFLSAFYRQIPGLTSRSPVRVQGVLTPLSWLRTQTHRVCPGCAQEGWLRVIHDLAFVDACPHHRCVLLSQCPRCAAALRWDTGSIARCPCGYDLASAERPEVDCTGARRVLAYLQTADAGLFRRLSEILRILRFDRISAPEERNRVLNLATALAENRPGALPALIEESRRVRPGLPARALAAPWLAARDADLRRSMEALLEQASPEYPGDCQHCDCATQAFGLAEVTSLFGISSKALDTLVAAGLLEKTSGKRYRQVQYPLPSLCRFLQSLAPPPQGRDAATMGRSLISAGSERALVVRVREIQGGRLKVIAADGRQGLRGVRVTASRHRTPGPPAQCLSVTRAAARLHTYPDAIRRAIKAGLLSVAAEHRRGTTVFLKTADVDAFDRDFVFVGALARRLGVGRTTLSAKLAHLGRLPVSGPTVDGALVALYRRADVDSLDRPQISAVATFKSHAGRKKGDPELYDKRRWMRSTDTAEALGVSPQGLRALVVHGLLREGVPSGRNSDNRRYFTVASVKSARQWLMAAVSWEKAAQRLGRSVSSLKQRFLRSDYVRPLRIGARQWVGAADIEHMRLHLEQFCTCVEADAWHAAPLKHFNNLVATGRIQPVPLQETDGVDSVTLLRWSEVRQLKPDSRMLSPLR